MSKRIDFRGQLPGVAVDEAGERIPAQALLALAVGDTWVGEDGREHTVTRRYEGTAGEQVVVSHGPAEVE